MYLKWSMFDSPDQPGSGYKFMEREPVIALDRAIGLMERKMFTDVVLGYASPYWAKKCRLSMNDSHRVGKAVLLRVPDAKKKWDLFKALLELNVPRLALQRNENSNLVYFDTDDLKHRGIFNWTFNEKRYHNEKRDRL